MALRTRSIGLTDEPDEKPGRKCPRPTDFIRVSLCSSVAKINLYNLGEAINPLGEYRDAHAVRVVRLFDDVPVLFQTEKGFLIHG